MAASENVFMKLRKIKIYPSNICFLKVTTETLEKGVKYNQS